ncbi:hypothetical protein Hanom_Chr07g00602111 [Helianthus anomalus]
MATSTISKSKSQTTISKPKQKTKITSEIDEDKTKYIEIKSCEIITMASEIDELPGRLGFEDEDRSSI